MHVGIHGRRKAEPDVNALADKRRETSELEGQRVDANRDRRKPVGAPLVRQVVRVAISDGPDRLTVTRGTTAPVCPSRCR